MKLSLILAYLLKGKQNNKETLCDYLFEKMTNMQTKKEFGSAHLSKSYDNKL